MDALISAQAGTALLIQGSDLASIHADSPEKEIPRRAEEARLLFGEAQDLQVLEGVDRDQVVRRLRREVDSKEALQLSLILLDPALSEEIRSEAAEELEGLLTEEECREGLERVLFAHPLPQEADLSGALAHSDRALRAKDLLSQLADLQPAIAEVRRAWTEIPDTLFASPSDRRRVQVALVREGRFRELVLVHRAGASIESFLLSSLLEFLGVGKRQELQRWLKPWRGGGEGEKYRPLPEMQTEDRAALTRRALTGDQTALSRLAAMLTPVINARVARTLLARRSLLAGSLDLRQEVEDQTQEVFLALFSRDAHILRSWQPERGLSLERFVGLVAERQVLSFLRSGQRHPSKETTALEGNVLDAESPGQRSQEGRPAARTDAGVIGEDGLTGDRSSKEELEGGRRRRG